jgi:hypothetical protein
MTTTALERVVEPLLPMTADDAAGAMAAYQELTAHLLTGDDWQGIPGRDQSFVKRSGWAKLATFYGVSTELRAREIDRDDDGQILRARCLVRATHPNGRYAEGDGACSATERRFAQPSGRQKLEHDLLATSFTRAINRATSNLIGFGEVSAEELDGTMPPTAAPSIPAQPWGPVTDSDEQLEQAARAVTVIAGDTPVNAEQFILAMGQHFDGIPEACTTMLRGLARFVGDARAKQTPENAPPDQSAYHTHPTADDDPGGQQYHGD